MRCSKARQRIIDEPLRIALDPDVQRHVGVCPACARFAQAERLLQRDLARVRAAEAGPTIPFASIQQEVTARAAARSASQVRIPTRMSELSHQLKRRPGLGLSIGAVAVLLIAFTLIPFKIDRTIGYEVAVAGVDKDLAIDTVRVHELLIALGLDGATYSVDNCEKTCQLTIRQLPSADDAQIVVAAFDQLNNCVVEFVTPVKGERKASLFGHARNELHFDGSGNVDTKTVTHIVMERIDSLNQVHNGKFSIFFGDPNDEHGVMELTSKSPDRPQLSIWVDGDQDKFVVKHPDGTEEHFSSDDPRLKELMEESGLHFESEDSEGNVSIRFGGGGMEANEAFGSTEAAAKDGVDELLPENFALDQNFPNPFNPTTTIGFTLPRSEFVTLEVFNVQGQRVRTLVNRELAAGTHAIQWDATGDGGDRVASGIYLYRLNAGDFSDSKKMTLLK